MKIRVNPHNVEIVREETEPINELEVKVSKCEFEFDEKITNEFVKEAYFTLNGSTYKQIIVNNECDYPNEVLTEKGTLEIGVVAYKVENGEELIRYNPSPDYYDTWVGSLKDAENSEPITPTDKEQMQSQISQNTSDISDLQANKQDKLTAGDNITIDENNVISAVDTIYDDTEIKQDITNLQNTKVDKIEGKGLSTNDYTTEEKNKLASLENYDDTEIKQELTSQGNQIEQNKTDIDTINTNLVNYSLITETGSKITLTIDNTTYQMYATLKDKNNNTISTSNIIDLPIEQLVMSVDYDNTTKEIVIELQNGEITRVPVGALISGLVSETQLEETLEDYVKNTDYATDSVGGVIKTSSSTYGVQVINGFLCGGQTSYSNYQNKQNQFIVSKGTLENVIIGKDLTTKAYVDGLVGDVESLLETLDVGSGV
jgi:hypothetical protein